MSFWVSALARRHGAARAIIGYPLMMIMAMCAASYAQADAIYQCTGAQGEPVFSSVPACDAFVEVTVSELETMTAMNVADVKKKIRTLRSIDLEKTANQNKKGPAKESTLGLGFGDRMELRKLQIRKEGIDRDLTNRVNGSADYTRLKQEARRLNKRIRQLQRRAEN